MEGSFRSFGSRHINEATRSNSESLQSIVSNAADALAALDTLFPQEGLPAHEVTDCHLCRARYENGPTCGGTRESSRAPFFSFPL